MKKMVTITKNGRETRVSQRSFDRVWKKRGWSEKTQSRAKTATQKPAQQKAEGNDGTGQKAE